MAGGKVLQVSIPSREFASDQGKVNVIFLHGCNLCFNPFQGIRL
jgi:hypothetical protein